MLFYQQRCYFISNDVVLSATTLFCQQRRCFIGNDVVQSDVVVKGGEDPQDAVSLYVICGKRAL